MGCVVHSFLGLIVLLMAVEMEDLKGIPCGTRAGRWLEYGHSFFTGYPRLKRPLYYGTLAFYLGMVSVPRAFKNRRGTFTDDIWVGYVFLSYVTANLSVMVWFCGCCCCSKT